ncbi:DUF3293 domain-containing protein [Streptomyces mangrovisoli]|uniref:DUF3293 domain-containing protein n=1 Tax=Streptomyces mangrovisoli TaxID=1428628 RepID=A0A1J4NZK5_9ACTN|nr:DUF3293 domain-containing protein [Streptomyces mangrovisoli]OIJ67458.1 hypothetical protein WN71_012775 [Streptomyces mangrovisoli]
MHTFDASAAPRNWDLYLAAVVDIRFEDRVVHVEPRSPGVAEGPFPGPAQGATVHVITAWNPLGRTASFAANARAHRLLLAEVRSLGPTWWPAEGRDKQGMHREESVAVVGLDDAAALGLGRRFGQDAIFAWTPDAWRLLTCDGGVTAARGWAAFETRNRSTAASRH